MPPRRDASVRAGAAAADGAAGQNGGAVYSRLDKPVSGDRARSSRCWWACVLPLLLVVVLAGGWLLVHWLRLQPGQMPAFITQARIVDRPGNAHARWRGADYVAAFPDRFFFQWWNFLVYDARTDDHWTLVLHTAHHSSASGMPHVASSSLVHRRGSEMVLQAHEAVPLDDNHVQVGPEWNIALRSRSQAGTGSGEAGPGPVSHRIELLDEDTYRVHMSFLPSHITARAEGDSIAAPESISLSLTFRRQHGVYTGLDSEEGNIEHCAVVSNLFGYHSRVQAGTIREGNGRVYHFGSDKTGAAQGEEDKHVRAYAAGSWGCRLPSGYPAAAFPWTWAWLSLPGDDTAVPPRPDIGIVLGTARYQTNTTTIGEIAGGYAHWGVGDGQVVATSTATLRAGSALPFRMQAVSSDSALRRFDVSLSRWSNSSNASAALSAAAADLSDEMGSFVLPLDQRYDVETAHWRLQLHFRSEGHQYFRCPVVVERMDGVPAAAAGAEAGASPAATEILQAFSDFRAVGVRVHVQLWHRSQTPEERLAREIHSRALGAPLPAAPAGSDAEQWRLGAWESLVLDKEVNTLNALEFAYEAPLYPQEMRKLVGDEKKQTGL